MVYYTPFILAISFLFIAIYSLSQGITIQKTIYGYCDKCHKKFKGAKLYEGPYQLEEDMIKNNWKVLNHKHYCPDCKSSVTTLSSLLDKS